MNAAADVRELYGGDFQRLAPALPGSGIPWLDGMRQRALQRFMEVGFPGVKNEDWKYTDVRAIATQRFAPSTASGRVEPAALPQFELGGPVVVFVDGHYSAALSETTSLVDGVSIASVAQALCDDPVTIEPWLG